MLQDPPVKDRLVVPTRGLLGSLPELRDHLSSSSSGVLRLATLRLVPSQPDSLDQTPSPHCGEDSDPSRHAPVPPVQVYSSPWTENYPVTPVPPVVGVRHRPLPLYLGLLDLRTNGAKGPFLLSPGGGRRGVGGVVGVDGTKWYRP